jgi:hypothetical protein
MAEEAWHEARLIPTSGISGPDEQERRATSALLAVMSSVREFGRTLTQPLGAPAGHVQAYIEVPFALGEARVIPDGLLRVSRGSRTWTALVEVKTGNHELEVQQLENYLDVAKEQGFDALVTISNQIPAIAGQHPTPVDRRKLGFQSCSAASQTSSRSATLRSGGRRRCRSCSACWASSARRCSASARSPCTVTENWIGRPVTGSSPR